MAQMNELSKKAQRWETQLVNDKPMTMKELNNMHSDIKEEIVESLRYRIQQKLSTVEIPKLLDPEIDYMVKEHFEEGGDGYVAITSIFNLFKIDASKRTPEQVSAILAYLRKVSIAYRKMETSLLEALVAKL